MENKKLKRKYILWVFMGLYAIFLFVSLLIQYEPGKAIAGNLKLFTLDMLKIFPPALIIIGLFTVWVDKKHIEKYLGEHSGVMGHLAGILLACTTLYPFIVVLPLADTLYKKGAKLSVVLTYISASSICRIPMTIYEASFIGIKFSIIRYLVSLPLVVISSIVIEKIVGKEKVFDTEKIEIEER